jgi:dolichol-phosphate mannosyltransferase
MPLDAGDFCLIDRAVVNVLRSMPESTRYVRGQRAWAGFRQIGVPYDRPARHAGESKYPLDKLVRLAFDGFASFSNAPLRLATWAGASLCLLATVLAVTLGAWWLSGLRPVGLPLRDVAGWTSLCCLVLTLSGCQMLLIGVLGEYVARIFDEVRSRPPWIIAEAVGIAPGTVALGWFAGPAESSPSPLVARRA